MRPLPVLSQGLLALLLCMPLLLAAQGAAGRAAQTEASRPSEQERVDALARQAYETVFSDAGAAYERAVEGLQLADSIDYDLGRGRCQYDMGLALLWQGYAPEALEFLYAAQELLEPAQDTFYLFQTYSAFAYVGWDQKDLDESLRYLRLAQPHALALGDTNLIISVYSDIAESYLRQELYDSAMAFLPYAEALATTTSDSFQMAVVKGQLAGVLVVEGRYREAIAAGREAAALSRRVNWNARAAWLHMAKAYEALNRPDSAIVAARRCIRVAREGSYLDEYVSSAHACLTEAFYEQGQVDSAMHHARMEAETYSQIVNAEKARRIQGMRFGQEWHASRLEQAQQEAAFQADLKWQRLQRNAGFAGAALFLGFSTLLFQRFRITRQQREVIAHQKSRVDALMRNILPERVAHELQEHGKTQAVRYDDASVLFTDFVDFTSISRSMRARDLVDELNVCFSLFDGIVGETGVEKIKTIGDAYLCVGGIPEAKGGHLEATMQTAFRMLEAIGLRNAEREREGLPAFQVRIGVHCGPLVAGVVGVRKFAYDVWGSTVNTASRVEAHGEAGAVHVSEAVFARLSPEGRYRFHPVDHAAVKGIGAMRTYRVERL